MKKIVLIVDDQDFLRTVLASIAERHLPEFQVVTKNDGVQAFDFYKENADNVALVLTDYQMPNMDGAELIRKIRELGKNVAIVFLSGNNPEDLPQDVPCDFFTRKPILDMELFIDLLWQTLESRKL